MRIKFSLPLLLVLGLMLVACQDNSSQQTQPRIAVVDMTRLMRDSVPGKEGVKYIENMQSAMQEKLDAIQDRLEKNPQDENAMKDLQREYATSQQRMQAEGQNVVNILLDAVQRVLNAFREKNGYDVIIGTDALATFNPAIDVTNAVMAEVDRQKLTFKPLPENAIAGDSPDGKEPGPSEGATGGTEEKVEPQAEPAQPEKQEN